MPSLLHRCLSFLTAALLLSPVSFAFDTPLSDEDIREAYFLGQRHDESMARLLSRYSKVLPPPESGPQIASVEFLTPYALLVRQASQVSDSSAQEFEKKHKSDSEIVAITIQILLTPSYPAFIPRPTNSRSGAAIGFQLRNPDFWKDFDYRVFDGDDLREPTSFSGEPVYTCGAEEGCDLAGATVYLKLPAKLFTSGSATVEVDPKVADPTSVTFDLDSLR
jgi:hypothetical protein